MAGPERLVRCCRMPVSYTHLCVHRSRRLLAQPQTKGRIRKRSRSQRRIALFFDKDARTATTPEQGGHAGPGLTTVADRLTTGQMTVRILNGGTTCPLSDQFSRPRESTAFWHSWNREVSTQIHRRSGEPHGNERFVWRFLKALLADSAVKVFPQWES